MIIRSAGYADEGAKAKEQVAKGVHGFTKEALFTEINSLNSWLHDMWLNV